MPDSDSVDNPGTGAAEIATANETAVANKATGTNEPAGEIQPGRVHRSPRRRLVPIVLAAAGLSVILLVLAVTLLPQLGGDEGLVFVIPAGAKAAVDVPTIDSAISIPTRIVFRAGEPAVITIHNQDTVPHRAGPFVVGAGQTLVQRFPEPGVYPIACSVDPLESIVVTVES